MKKSPYSVRFSENEAQKIAAWCAANNIEVPDDNSALKDFIFAAIRRKAGDAPAPVDVRQTPEYQGLQAEHEKLQKEYADHQADSGERIDKLTYAIEQQWRPTCDALQKNIDGQKQEIDVLNEALKKMHGRTDGAVIIHMQPNTRGLLKAVCTRLSERLADRYPDGVTPAMLMEDMFLRYERDRYTEWFYPWVLSRREVAEILTGESEEREVESHE